MHQPYGRTVYAPSLGPHCTCASSKNTLCMHHPQNHTVHAPPSRSHCTCASSGTSLHMCQPLDRTAHAPSLRQQCACTSSGTTLRMRHLQEHTVHVQPLGHTAHAPVPRMHYVCGIVHSSFCMRTFWYTPKHAVFLDSSLCMQWVQGTLGAKIVRSRGRLRCQSARANRQGALKIRREKSTTEPKVQELTACPAP